MNKNLYRIIFSKARNMFIAVGENSKSQTKAAGESAKISTSIEVQDNTALHQHWVVKSLVASISLWMPLAPVYAQIQADTSANAANRPVIGVGVNNQGQNVPVVNIQTPVNGVSHNKYKQMDVLNNGVVLNNSRTGAGSVIVGSVGANPFLATGEARLILNEINSTAATRFEGNLEVAGQRADVVIANPAGINIKGGGFINANKAIFTTGKPQLNADGSLQQFVVDQGTVTVSANAGSNLGLGGNNNNADYVDIYARALELNAQLHANQDINVITGANTISSNLESIESKTSTAAVPLLAVDIKSLGGMYANNIYLMGSEKGLGVSNAGILQAVNNIVVTNTGKIVHSGTISTTDKKNGLVSVATTGAGTAADIAVSGSINSYGLISVDSGNDLNLTAKDITVNYDATTKNSAALIVSAKENINLATGTKINNLSTAGDLYIDAKGINLAANSELRSNRGSATINANENLISNSTARLIAAQDLNLSGNKNLKLIGNTLQATTGSINIQSAAADAQLLQVEGGTLYAGKDLNVQGAGDVSLKNLSFNLVNDTTRLKNINVYSGNNLIWDNKAKPLPKISGKVQLEAKQGLELSGTAIHAANGIVTQSDTLTLNSAIKSDQGIDLTTEKAMTLARGANLTATKHVNLASLQGSIEADSLKANSSQGRISIIASENVNLNSSQTIVSASHADRDEQITDKTVINADQGIIIASVEKGSINVNSTDLISARGDLQILGQNGVVINSNTDVVVSGDTALDTLLTNQIEAKSVSIGTKKGNIDVQNTALESTVDQLHLNSEEGMLKVNNTTLRSKGNTEIYAKDILSLENVAANSDQHLAINSKRTLYLNADYTPTGTIWATDAKTSLNANGILSLTATGNQVMQNATLTGGAVLLETTNLFVKPGLVFNAIGSDLLKNDAKLNSLNGDLSIQTTGTTGLTIDPKIMTLSAVGDIELIAKSGVLKLVGYGGTQGNGSEQVVKLNTIGGGINLEGLNIELQGAQLNAKSDINIISSSGDILVDGVKNAFLNFKNETVLNKLILDKNELEILANAPNDNYEKDKEDLISLALSLKANNTKVSEWERRVNIFTQEVEKFNKKYKTQMTFNAIRKQTGGRASGWLSYFELNFTNPLQVLIDEKQQEIDFFDQNLNGYEHTGTRVVSELGDINITSNNGLSISGSDLIAKSGLINLESRGVLDDGYTLTSNSETSSTPKTMAASMIIDGHTNFYDIGSEDADKYSMRTLVNPTKINGDKGVNIKTVGNTVNDNLVMQATGIVSNGDIKIESNKNILFDSAIEQSYDKTIKIQKKKSWGGLKKKTITTVTENNDVDAASVDFYGKNITIESKDQNKDISIDIYSGKFTANGGNISIKAGGDLNFYTVEESSTSDIDIKKTSSFSGIKYNNSKTNSTRTQVSDLPATLKADYIGTKSGFDTRLEGTEFEYLKGATIEAGGKLELIAAKTTITELLKKEKNSVVWQSMQDKGSITETAQLPQFNGPVLPTFKAAGGLSVQIPISEKDQNKVVIRDEILKLANQPGNAYLKEFVNRKDVDWNTVILAQKDWDYKSQGLSGAGAAIVVLVVAALTYGAGTALAGTVTVTATGSTTTLGGITLATTVGSGASAVTTYTAVGSMFNAALTSLATQSSISLINNGGDLTETFKELGSKEYIKNLATTVATVGLLDSVSTTLNIKINDMPQLEQFANNFVKGVGGNIISSAASGGSLSDNLDSIILSGFSSAIHAELASSIGENFSPILKDNPDIFDKVLHKIIHIAAACATGSIIKQCEANAIGAGVGEVLAEAMLKNNIENQTSVDETKIKNYGKIISGIISAYAGYDVYEAATSSETVIENNALASARALVAQAKRDCAAVGLSYGSNGCKSLLSKKYEMQPALKNALVRSNIAEFVIETFEDSTPIWGDFKAFKDASNGTEYLIATVGILPIGDMIKAGKKTVILVLNNGTEVEAVISTAGTGYKVYVPAAGKDIADQMAKGKEVISTTYKPNARQTVNNIKGVDKAGNNWSVELIGDGSKANKAAKVTYVDVNPNGVKTTKVANIAYDSRGLPIFDNVAKFTTKITTHKTEDTQFKYASLSLWEAIQKGQVNSSQFTTAQLKQIKDGATKITGYTWHHNAQSAPNNMQLLPEAVHNAVKHIGQESLKNGVNLK